MASASVSPRSAIGHERTLCFSNISGPQQLGLKQKCLRKCYQPSLETRLYKYSHLLYIHQKLQYLLGKNVKSKNDTLSLQGPLSRIRSRIQQDKDRKVLKNPQLVWPLANAGHGPGHSTRPTQATSAMREQHRGSLHSSYETWKRHGRPSIPHSPTAKRSLGIRGEDLINHIKTYQKA